MCVSVCVCVCVCVCECVCVCCLLSKIYPFYVGAKSRGGQSEGGNPLCDAMAFDDCRRPDVNLIE